MQASRKSCLTIGVTLLCVTRVIAADVSKLPIAEGKHATYHHSHNLNERHDQIEQAVIVIHGTLRNPKPYLDRIAHAAALSKVAGKTLLVAPGFHTKDEAKAGEYIWSSGGWKQGDLAQNGRDKFEISSFDVVDRLIRMIVKKDCFPQLKRLVIVGHSAGGQFVNRYASAADLTECRDISVRFVVMNPSSYMYLDGRRPDASGFLAADQLSKRTPDYDRYRYGVTELNTAMRRIGLDQIKENIVSRPCFYFGGVDDTRDKYLDMSPGAMAQGRNRFTRFEGYDRYVGAYEDKRWRKNSTFIAIDNVGHSSTQMLATEQVRDVLFQNVVPSGNAWIKDQLQKARTFSKTLDTAALTILHHGDVVDQWGPVALPLKCHSTRKSILSALYGPHVADGSIDPDATLKELGINDNEPSLTDAERAATIRDLLKARSGCYHPALFETAAMAAKRPQRGAHPPNSFWYYNNWDFNAACSIFENLTGRSLFEDFETRIATPLGMQDFRRERDTRYVTGDDSVHPAYPFHLSTRDLALFGQLMLQNGRWDDQQLIPATWIKESTSSYSETGSSGGYGYMWWVAVDGRHFPGVTLPRGTYSARGYRGQYLVVIPEWDIVVCHRVNSFQKNTSVSKSDFGKLLAMILEARPKVRPPSKAVTGSSNGQPTTLDGHRTGTLYDVVIRHGEVIDGTGRERFPADVAIKNGRIAKIGDLTNVSAARTIDATGRLICPGFIDLHSHAEMGLVSDDPARRGAPNLITQGITTVVVNQDGGGPLDLDGQRESMQRLGVGMNVIQALGHGTIRAEVLGDDHKRPASPEENAKMQKLLRSAMSNGAFGMSAGLEYVPGRWSTPREMEVLAGTVAEFDGLYIVHERSSGSSPMWFLPSRDSADQPSMLDNLRELILIAGITNVTTVATHIKARGTDFWGSGARMNALIQKARDDGLRFYADQYPYNTSGTDGRIVLIPQWAAEANETDADSDPDYAARLQFILADESLVAKVRQDIAHEITRRGGAKSILIIEHPNEELIGQSLAEFAINVDATSVDAAIKLQLDGDGTRRGGCRLRAFSMSEEDVEAFAKTPWTATSSDARIALPSDGPVHPRFYGAFPRKIRHYAIDRKLFSIEEAIRVSTSLPAEILRLKNRGVIRVGAMADIVVFDPRRIRDKADAFNPHQYSEGVEYVLVNGKLAVAHEQWLGHLAGKVLSLQEDTKPQNSESPQ